MLIGETKILSRFKIRNGTRKTNKSAVKNILSKRCCIKSAERILRIKEANIGSADENMDIKTAITKIPQINPIKRDLPMVFFSPSGRGDVIVWSLPENTIPIDLKNVFMYVLIKESGAKISSNSERTIEIPLPKV
jgi:hypothetical protein